MSDFYGKPLAVIPMSEVELEIMKDWPHNPNMAQVGDEWFYIPVNEEQAKKDTVFYADGSQEQGSDVLSRFRKDRTPEVKHE